MQRLIFLAILSKSVILEAKDAEGVKRCVIFLADKLGHYALRGKGRVFCCARAVK